MKLELQKSTAKKLYPESPGWFQEILKENFGEDIAKKPDFRDIKTFDDACRHCGISEKVFNESYKQLNLNDDTVAYEKCKIIVKAINQGWVPDWDNTNQKKWWPWFRLSSWFGFVNSYSDYDFSDTTVGSRLCFETKEKSDYAAKQFLDIYEQFQK